MSQNSQNSQKEDFKCIVIGDCNAGKTEVLVNILPDSTDSTSSPSSKSSRKPITCLVVGDSNVGKTSYLKALHGDLPTNILSYENGSARLSMKAAYVDKGFTQELALNYVDVELIEVGESSITSAPKADCAIIVIDVTRYDALASCNQWFQWLLADNTTKVFVVGNKHDIIKDPQIVQNLYCGYFGVISSFCEISSVTGENIFAPINCLIGKCK